MGIFNTKKQPARSVMEARANQIIAEAGDNINIHKAALYSARLCFHVDS